MPPKSAAPKPAAAPKPTPVLDRLDRSRYGGNSAQDVWDKAEKYKTLDPNMYRKDADGNKMYRDSYGKSSPLGWEIDHNKPQSKGGSNNIRNLQAMNTSANRSYQDSKDKPSRHG